MSNTTRQHATFSGFKPVCLFLSHNADLGVAGEAALC